jgi:hypothetical protein
LLAPPPNRAFVSELARRRVNVDVGQCIVEADSAQANEIRSVVRERHLPLASTLAAASQALIEEATHGCDC